MLRIYYADGFKGFLTACAKLVRKPFQPLQFQLIKATDMQLGIFRNGIDDADIIRANERMVRKFTRQLVDCISDKFYESLDRAFRHNSPEKETYCYHAIRLGLDYGASVIQFKQDIKIARFLKMAEEVNLEIQRFCSGENFNKHNRLKIFLAVITTKYDILDVLARYFQIRLNWTPWMILTQKQMATWDGEQLTIKELHQPRNGDSQIDIEKLWAGRKTGDRSQPISGALNCGLL
ncbi:DUF4130 domain-containing protein [candidate division KSB1 bacterium]|nr:DUF4130 domain-containing protein [candidate division KSB1 bacterium]